MEESELVRSESFPGIQLVLIIFQSPFMRAAKENESIHVIKAVKKSELSRSILKVSTKFTACVDCVICRCKTFKTLPELKSHFEGGHNCALTIKTIPASLDQPAFVQKTPSGKCLHQKFANTSKRDYLKAETKCTYEQNGLAFCWSTWLLFSSTSCTLYTVYYKMHLLTLIFI